MTFTERLKSLGIYYSPDDTPGGGKSRQELMDLTDAKISGTLEDPEPDPEPAPDPDPDPDPKGKDGDEDDVDDPDPKGKDDDEDDVDDPDPKGKDDDEDDVDDGLYYNPEKHVKGRKPAHTNTFKTKEQAEYAAVQKASMVKDVLEKMDEEGIDRGAIPLPDALNGSIESLDTLTDLQNIVGMDDDGLRSWLDDSDRFRQRLTDRMDRKQKEQQARKANSEFEELQVQTFDELQKLMNPTVIAENKDKFTEVDRATEFINSKITEKVKDEIAEDRQDLENWIEKVDSGEIDISYRDFDKEKERRLDAIQAKENKIREQYTPLIDNMKRLDELSNNIEGQKEMTPKERAKKTWENFSEWQEDRQSDLAILEDTPEAKAELVAFKNWAIQNKDGLHDHPTAWNQALKDWDDFKNKIRSKRQKDELEGGKGKRKSDSKTDDDIPKPGDQDKLKKKKDEDTRFIRPSMQKLMDLTDATVGT